MDAQKDTGDKRAEGDGMPKSLLQKNNGNYIAALIEYIDTNVASAWTRKLLKTVVLGLIVAIVICMLIWPFVIRG